MEKYNASNSFGMKGGERGGSFHKADKFDKRCCVFSCRPVACATRRRQTGDDGRTILHQRRARACWAMWLAFGGGVVSRDVGRHDEAQEISDFCMSEAL